jgi:hypothetical protein
MRDEFDEHPAPVISVPHSSHTIGSLETVEHKGDRTGAEPCRLSQGTCRHGAVLIEQVTATSVGGVEPEHLPECLVKSVGRGQEGPESPTHFLYGIAAPICFHILP